MIGMTSHHIPRVFFKNEKISFTEVEKTFERIALEFQKGHRLLLFLIPHRMTVDKKYRKKILSVYDVEPKTIDISKPKLKFLALLDRYNLNGIDLTPFFLKEGLSKLYYPIDGHLSLEGNKVTANALLPQVIAMIE